MLQRLLLHCTHLSGMRKYIFLPMGTCYRGFIRRLSYAFILQVPFSLSIAKELAKVALCSLS